MSAPCSMGRTAAASGGCKPLWLALFGSVHKPVELSDLSDEKPARHRLDKLSGIARPSQRDPGPGASRCQASPTGAIGRVSGVAEATPAADTRAVSR